MRPAPLRLSPGTERRCTANGVAPPHRWQTHKTADGKAESWWAGARPLMLRTVSAPETSAELPIRRAMVRSGPPYDVRGIADPQGDGSLWTTLRNHDGPVCQVNLVTPGIATAYLPSASGSVGGSASQA